MDFLLNSFHVQPHYIAFIANYTDTVHVTHLKCHPHCTDLANVKETGAQPTEGLSCVFVIAKQEVPHFSLQPYGNSSDVISGAATEEVGL